MRPLELRVRNFRSYSGEHVFDFTDRSLVAIVGPIGSGKSSVLDAIVFALYGRTPRIPTATKTLIHQRSADAAVSLRFEVEGELWEATRSIRIKGASRHALYRYEDPAGDAVEKLTLEGEVNEKIVELLGLDYSAFERSVLLAQGRFAEFLQARPAERDRVLKGVFGHDRVDRMKSLARERLDAAALELERLSVRLERFDEIDQQLAVVRSELSEVITRHEQLSKVAARYHELETGRVAAQKTTDEIVRRIASLDGQAARLPDVDVTGRAVAEARAAANRRLELAGGLEQAQQALKEADRALQEENQRQVPDMLGRAAGLLAVADPQMKAVADAERRIADAERLVEDARAEEGAARVEAERASANREQTLARAEEAAGALTEAEMALERGRHADMAATLRAGLDIDERCPVCDQVVAELPQSSGEPRLVQLEEALASARRIKSERDKAHTDALTSLERASGRQRSASDRVVAAMGQLTGARDDVTRARADLDETSRMLEEMLGPGDPAEGLSKRKRAYEALVAAREGAQRRADQVRRDHDQAIRDEQQATKSLQDLRVRLADLAARLEVDLEIEDDPESLATALEVLRRTWSESTASLRLERTESESTLGRIEGEQARMLDEAGVRGDINAEVAVAADRIVRLEARVARDEAEIAKADELTVSRQSLESRVSVFGTINRDLTDSRFIRFLLDDERTRLAELGSEHFQRLSAGRYRFADDQFAILDLTAADATRRADSLSGGETFLASLGLALALAEMVAGTGGRLDAFFLDEGFGTLDPEHLDLAMEGVETLVADQADRLVVIVSHVPELRERIEDLIELERNPVTGDTRVVSG